MSEANLQNRTIFCHDNLEVLQGINSNSIDLIYLDPPFNKNKVFTAPIGSSAEGASFKDWFREEDVKDEWLQTIKEDNEKLHSFLESVKIIEGKASYNFCYLSYLVIRLLEMHRVLKETGSIYLHCDPTMSHYIKLLMDIVFGEKNFRNEIVWGYKGDSNIKNGFLRKHDYIIFYSKNKNNFNLDKVRVKYANENKIIKGRYGTYSRNKLGKKCLDWWEDIPSFSTATNSKERTGYPPPKSHSVY